MLAETTTIWEPQPGTVPFRAINWLRRHGAGKPVATAVICDALGIDPNGFSTSMKPAIRAGVVSSQALRGFGHAYFWSLEGAQPPAADGDDSDDGEPARSAADIQPRPGPLFPGVTTVSPGEPEFRVTIFDGHLLATGMDIVDGVAVFTPEQLHQLKRVTDWAPITNKRCHDVPDLQALGREDAAAAGHSAASAGHLRTRPEVRVPAAAGDMRALRAGAAGSGRGAEAMA